MANQEIHTPKDYSEVLRKLLTTDPAHADTFNSLFERLINNDAYLKAFIEGLVKASTGHKHSGVDGDGAKIPFANIDVPPAQGSIVTATQLQNHVNERNPHGTRASDVGAYVKPATGIPKTDLETGVQTLLDGINATASWSEIGRINVSSTSYYQVFANIPTKYKFLKLLINGYTNNGKLSFKFNDITTNNLKGRFFTLINNQVPSYKESVLSNEINITDKGQYAFMAELLINRKPANVSYGSPSFVIHYYDSVSGEYVDGTGVIYTEEITKIQVGFELNAGTTLLLLGCE